MLWKRVILSLVLIFFLFLTVRAVNAHGYLGVILMFNSNPATELLSWDLIISLALVSIWLVADARKHGHAFVPFLLITLFFGVAGPLLYLILRGFSLRMQRVEASLVFLGLCAYSAITHPLADLRREIPEIDQASAETRGRALMQASAEAHGLTAWRRYQTHSVEARDLWLAESWWPEREQGLRLHFLSGTFTSQAQLLDGAGMGQLWGIQAWTPYRQEHFEAPLLALDGPAPEISFYLPSLHYFAELPFRLLEAEHLIYQGKAKLHGKTYERVLATWGAPQPNARHDQYMLWINSETKLIEMARYTVRDAADLRNGFQKKLMQSLAMGTIHFEDYRKVEGVWLPYVHTITLQPPELTRFPLDKNYFHRLEIQDIQFDAVSPELLCPLNLEAEPGDRKSQDISGPNIRSASDG